MEQALVIHRIGLTLKRRLRSVFDGWLVSFTDPMDEVLQYARLGKKPDVPLQAMFRKSCKKVDVLLTGGIPDSATEY
jgi:hypothetical protein